MMTAYVFWLFAAVTIASGFLVITARNPVHSVLWLILAFFSSAGLFVLMGAEFLAMLLVIVYVGAVAVLFLFVVMMLDINFTALREGYLEYIPIGALIGLVLLAELLSLVSVWHFGENFAGLAPSATALAASNNPAVTNTEALGRVIYTDYAFIFQISGLILLVAMIGAVVLTLRSRSGVKRQSPGKQSARRPEDAFSLVDVTSGEGVTLVATPRRKSSRSAHKKENGKG